MESFDPSLLSELLLIDLEEFPLEVSSCEFLELVLLCFFFVSGIVVIFKSEIICHKDDFTCHPDSYIISRNFYNLLHGITTVKLVHSQEHMGSIISLKKGR